MAFRRSSVVLFRARAAASGSAGTVASGTGSPGPARPGVDEVDGTGTCGVGAGVAGVDVPTCTAGGAGWGAIEPQAVPTTATRMPTATAHRRLVIVPIVVPARRGRRPPFPGWARDPWVDAVTRPTATACGR